MITKEQRAVLDKARGVANDLGQIEAEIELYYAQKSFTGGDIQTPHLSMLKRERTIITKNWLAITDSQEYKAAVEADTA
jgi:hypothetical protein